MPVIMHSIQLYILFVLWKEKESKEIILYLFVCLLLCVHCWIQPVKAYKIVYYNSTIKSWCVLHFFEFWFLLKISMNWEMKGFGKKWLTYIFV